jgi:hypothetical protein
MVLSIAACEKQLEKYPPPPPCEGPGCVSGGGKGSGAGGASGGTGGAGGAPVGPADLNGTVHRISSPTFDDQAMIGFTGSATILAPGPSGNVTAQYGGSVGTTFDLPGVNSGVDWVLVQDASGGGSGILSTYSPVSLPSTSPIALPVLDAGLLTNIASNLPTVSAKGVSSLAAQVILIVTHQGAPYKGLAVTGGTGGAEIAYDIGPGAYSDQTMSTSTGGTIILFNAGIAGSQLITLTDTSTMMSYGITIQAATGAATIAAIEI